MDIMRITIVRLLTRNQVVREIQYFDKYHNTPEGALHAGSISSEEYERWRSLIHSLQAYEEGEGIEISVEEVFPSIRLLRKVLTEERMRLLEQIDFGVDSITELAKKVGHRNLKNVYEDLQILKRIGLITLEKEEKRVIPRLLLSSIRIDFQ
jgi:predicted transcriptional regulator